MLEKIVITDLPTPILMGLAEPIAETQYVEILSLILLPRSVMMDQKEASGAPIIAQSFAETDNLILMKNVMMGLQTQILFRMRAGPTAAFLSVVTVFVMLWKCVTLAQEIRMMKVPTHPAE